MTWYSVHVELDTHIKLDQYGDLHETLTAYHPAVGDSPEGYLSIRMSLQAETVDQATHLARLVAVDAAGRYGTANPEVLYAEATREDLFDRRLNDTPDAALMSAQEAADLLGITRQAVAQRADYYGGQRVGGTWVYRRAVVETRKTQRGRNSHTAQAS